ncbi:uncharacterized protein LOC113309568 [Papaver somniferum]|uniref:uncharacterized protein LOC113309568 n=1 Tax=Papaver somniferum TaxID=3469 RepID=UPI000E705533|nr:uncharacterized protein LOC113309568 [Papaver somniferum]
MFRSLFYKLGVTLKRKLINGESSSSSSFASTAKYYLFTSPNQNVLIKNPRVTSTLSSFSTAASSNSNITSASDYSFVVSYLINSCGLSRTEAITASRKLNFKTRKTPDTVLVFLKAYGFTELHISKLINKYPSILLSNPNETLEPTLDFFKSKGLSEIDLANFISSFPGILKRDLNQKIIPSFDTLKSVVQSDENVVKMIKRDALIISADRVKKVMVNVELFRNEGVPEAIISEYLILHPTSFTADRFVEILRKVKGMGFGHLKEWVLLERTFLKAVHMLTIMSEASWRNKMDVYKRCGGWTEDQMQSALRKDPGCMKASEKKIMAVMDFLVNEMSYDSSIVAENPVVFCCSLEDKIIPRCSVIRVLVSRGFIKENISLGTLATLVDESFMEKFVNKYEQEVPGLMKVFEGKLNYQKLLQK